MKRVKIVTAHSNYLKVKITVEVTGTNRNTVSERVEALASGAMSSAAIATRLELSQVRVSK